MGNRPPGIVEAESVALICCETLGLEGADFCRGYIQHWLKAEKEIPNHNAARIFAAATSILKAGTPGAGGQLAGRPIATRLTIYVQPSGG